MDESQLRTIWQQRQFNDRVSPLSHPLGLLMKQTLARKFKQLGQMSMLWDEAIPEDIAAHTALESFQRGVLTVMVDSAPHRFQLQTLLMNGVLKYMQSRFSGALNKVRLIPGQFASIDLNGSRRYEF
jgi:hypothetical protein